MEIKGFTFWRSWHEQCELLDDTDRLAYMDAIRRYAFDGTVPSKDSVSQIVYVLFVGAISNIDANLTNIVNGSKGGRPTTRSGKSNNPPFNPPCFNETTPLKRGDTSNLNSEFKFKSESESEIKSEIKGEGDVSPSAPSKNSRFVKPTEAELAEWLMREKGLTQKDANDMAERFIYHYNSNGWMVGKTPMKCWRSAAAGWVKRDRQSAEAAQEQTQGMNAGFDLEQYRYRPSATTGQGGGGTTEGRQTHEEARGLIEMPLAMIQH